MLTLIKNFANNEWSSRSYFIFGVAMHVLAVVLFAVAHLRR